MDWNWTQYDLLIHKVFHNQCGKLSGVFHRVFPKTFHTPTFPQLLGKTFPHFPQSFPHLSFSAPLFHKSCGKVFHIFHNERVFHKSFPHSFPQSERFSTKVFHTCGKLCGKLLWAGRSLARRPDFLTSRAIEKFSTKNAVSWLTLGFTKCIYSMHKRYIFNTLKIYHFNAQMICI